MDFKVAGTRQGVTSIQMDIKIAGLEFKIVSEALEKAKQARLHILDIMDQAIPQPRSQLSTYSPRFHSLNLNGPVPTQRVRISAAATGAGNTREEPGARMRGSAGSGRLR